MGSQNVCCSSDSSRACEKTHDVASGLSSQAAVAAASFQEREVCATEDRFRCFEGLDLASSCLLAHLVVLQKPITFCVQRRNVFKGRHQSLGGGALLFSV